MAYRDLGNIDEKIIQSILQMGAENGVQKVSSKKLAKRCGISTYTIFEHFGTMQAALDAAAQYFDKKQMAKSCQMARDNLTAEEIWDEFLEYFLANPDGFLYYISYINTFGFDPTSKNPRAQEFLKIAKVFFRSEQQLTDNEYLILWDYITTMAFYYAEKFIFYMPYDDTNRALVKNIVFGGINHILCK